MFYACRLHDSFIFTASYLDTVLTILSQLDFKHVEHTGNYMYHFLQFFFFLRSLFVFLLSFRLRLFFCTVLNGWCLQSRRTVFSGRYVIHETVALK
jgi:hypothetical protein